MTRRPNLGRAASWLLLVLLAPTARAEKEVASLLLGFDRQGGVARLAISPDGKQVAALVRGGWDGQEKSGDNVRIVDVKTKKEVVRLRPGWGNARGGLLAYTPDSKQVVCSSEKAVYVFDLKSGKLARTFTTRAARPIQSLSG